MGTQKSFPLDLFARVNGLISRRLPAPDYGHHSASPDQRRAAVFYRRPLQLHHRVRQAIEYLVALSAAVLLSYLILRTR